jgi:hypothetical protein
MLTVKRIGFNMKSVTVRDNCQYRNKTNVLNPVIPPCQLLDNLIASFQATAIVRSALAPGLCQTILAPAEHRASGVGE